MVLGKRVWCTGEVIVLEKEGEKILLKKGKGNEVSHGVGEGKREYGAGRRE